MDFEFTEGIIQTAQKIVIYGPEGVGKSTLASKFPKPIFIDSEGSTKRLNVKRFGKKPSSWVMLTEQVKYIISKPDICGTLVIDTFDWAEQLCIEQICSAHQKSGIEDFGYGNGYVYEKEEIGRFLMLLEEVISKGINVVLVAHAHIKKFEQPDEMGAYDRWELKLGKKTGSQISPLVKEWADAVFFCNYKTYVVQTDDKGKKFKAQGKDRMIYTSHHPCWDAKNRYDLPEEIPMDYSYIAPFIPDNLCGDDEIPKAQPVHKTVNRGDFEEILDEYIDKDETETPTTPSPVPEDTPKPKRNFTAESIGYKENLIPKAVRDLMEADGITEEEIRKTVYARGFFPEETPISKYDQGFIEGWIIPFWSQLVNFVKTNIRK